MIALALRLLLALVLQPGCYEVGTSLQARYRVVWMRAFDGLPLRDCDFDTLADVDALIGVCPGDER